MYTAVDLVYGQTGGERTVDGHAFQKVNLFFCPTTALYRIGVQCSGKKGKRGKIRIFSLLTLCWLAAADGPFPSYLHAPIHCAAGSHGRSSQKGERSQKAMGKRDPFRSLGFRTMTDSPDDIYPYSFSPPSRPNQNQKKKWGKYIASADTAPPPTNNRLGMKSKRKRECFFPPLSFFSDFRDPVSQPRFIAGAHVKIIFSFLSPSLPNRAFFGP